jgi:hypothetical protein
VTYKAHGPLVSSPGLKAQVSFSGCPSILLSVNIYIFDFFSRTTWPILTRFCTNHLWEEEIQVSPNEREHPSPREDDSKRVKKHQEIFKIFSGTSVPISIKLGTKRLCVNVQIKDQILFKGGIILKMQK